MLFIAAVLASVITAFSGVNQSNTKTPIFQEPKQVSGLKPRHGYLTGADGVRLFYRIVGRGKPGCVFLHGGPGLHMNNGWPDLEPLSKGRTVLLYDQRGGGRSELVTDPNLLTAHNHVRDLEALRRHFAIKRMTLIGYSWGTGLAVLYAAEHPHRVNRLLLLSTMPPAKKPFADQRESRERALTSNSELERAAELERILPTANDPVAVCQELDSIGYRPYFFDPKKQRRMRTKNCDAPPEAVRNSANVFASTISSLRDWDFRPLLSRLGMPSLVVEGDRSEVAVGGPAEWAKSLPNGRLLLIPNAGHMPQIEQPHLVFPAIERFLRGRWPREAQVVH